MILGAIQGVCSKSLFRSDLLYPLNIHHVIHRECCGNISNKKIYLVTRIALTCQYLGN